MLSLIYPIKFKAKIGEVSLVDNNIYNYNFVAIFVVCDSIRWSNEENQVL